LWEGFIIVLQRVCFSQMLGNERGTALVVALILLWVLTIIGLAATNTSTLEVLISGSEKEGQEAFYAADGGIEYGLHQIALSVSPEGTYNLSDANVEITVSKSIDLSVTQRAGTSIAFGDKVLKKTRRVYMITSVSTRRGKKTIKAKGVADVWEPR